MNVLFISENSIPNGNLTKVGIAKLSPDTTSKVFLSIAIGKDFPRHTNHLNIWTILIGAWIHILFIIFATIMLYFLRRGDLMHRSRITAAFVDVIIMVTGGGNIRFRDKLEKIFFAFLLLGSFYINAIRLDNFLFSTFLAQSPERVDTFEKFAKMNPIVIKIDVGINHPIVKNFRFEYCFLFN